MQPLPVTQPPVCPSKWRAVTFGLRASFLDEFQALFLSPWLQAALNRSYLSDRVTRD